MSIKEVNTNVQSSSDINAEVEEWLRQQKIESVGTNSAWLYEEDQTKFELSPEQQASLQEWIDSIDWENKPELFTTPRLDDNWDGPEDLNW